MTISANESAGRDPVKPDSAKHVLVVEDEPKIGALLRDYLAASAFRVSLI